MPRTLPLVGLAIAAALLAGCTASPGVDPGSDPTSTPSICDYTSSDGSTTAVCPDDRGEPIDFATSLDDGTPISTDDLRGQVVVLNFWYADCPPCRLEARDLEAIHERYVDGGEVEFLGVNVRDTGGRADSFIEEFGITYPTILDSTDNTVQLAFSGRVAPGAVPTTVVLDREGRVAARITGLITDPELLATFIDEALAETETASS